MKKTRKNQAWRSQELIPVKIEIDFQSMLGSDLTWGIRMKSFVKDTKSYGYF